MERGPSPEAAGPEKAAQAPGIRGPAGGQPPPGGEAAAGAPGVGTPGGVSGPAGLPPVHRHRGRVSAHRRGVSGGHAGAHGAGGALHFHGVLHHGRGAAVGPADGYFPAEGRTGRGDQGAVRRLRQHDAHARGGCGGAAAHWGGGADLQPGAPLCEPAVLQLSGPPEDRLHRRGHRLYRRGQYRRRVRQHHQAVRLLEG